jgi:hypothetical protein
MNDKTTSHAMGTNDNVDGDVLRTYGRYVLGRCQIAGRNIADSRLTFCNDKVDK